MRMKVTINGKVSKDVLTSILNEQKEKIEVITTFCKKHKITELSYKDNVLEYDYEVVPTKTKTKEVETRWKKKQELLRSG